MVSEKIFLLFHLHFWKSLYCLLHAIALVTVCLTFPFNTMPDAALRQSLQVQAWDNAVSDFRKNKIQFIREIDAYIRAE